jgi:hypothetical protein
MGCRTNVCAEAFIGVLRDSPYGVPMILGLRLVGSLPLLKAYHGDAFVRQRDSDRIAGHDGEA